MKRLPPLLPAALLATALLPARPVRAEGFTTLTDFAHSRWMRMPEREAWRTAVPEVEEVEIPSSADGSRQRALFHDPGSAEPRPLLVVLHSWSEDWLQPHDIPYGAAAVRNGWVFIHPDYRGRFLRPEATGSALAQRDVLDAVEYAKRVARVDSRRVWLVGYSGGAMMALLLAGRHPQLWDAVVAWGPVYDLAKWHRETQRKYPRYAREVRQSCGGAPFPGTRAAAECRRRSPRTWLGGARGSAVRVFLGIGIDDPFVLPSHGLSAFNDLAAARHRLTPQQVEQMATRHRLPAELARAREDPVFAAVGRPLLFERTSGRVVLRVYEGRHDVIYNAGLLWLAGQIR